MRVFKVLLVFALLGVLGVGVIHADEMNGVPVFNDGRVNNWQIAAPVAVYCTFDHTQNVNVGVFQGIQVWGLSSDQILNVTAAQIAAAKGATTLGSADGVTLGTLADGSFQLNAGSYVFDFARGDTNC